MRTIRYTLFSRQLGAHTGLGDSAERFVASLRARLADAYPDASVEIAVHPHLDGIGAGAQLRGFDNPRAETARVELLAAELLQACSPRRCAGP